MSKELVELWMRITTKNLYRSWTGGVIAGLFFHKGLLDNTPLYDFIKEHFKDKDIHRLVHFNSVEANSGTIVSFDETNDKESFTRGLVATASVPFIFPPLQIGDGIMIDGGVAWNLDLSSAINKCRTLVDSDEKIVLDIIDVDLSVDHLP